MKKPKIKIPQNEFYGMGLFETPFEIRKWKISWKFPFIHKVVVWKGTPIEAQQILNKLRVIGLHNYKHEA